KRLASGRTADRKTLNPHTWLTDPDGLGVGLFPTHAYTLIMAIVIAYIVKVVKYLGAFAIVVSAFYRITYLAFLYNLG
ncbi:hypothetical protein, partial [Undibacterium sp. CCC3.4]|uniref:hypothetical protein n=1 Tax=Undibacterium sp. CCC3.4 TaxID=3048609 RepID=UPI002B226C59